MHEEGSPGFDEQTRYLVTDVVDGDSLEAAWRDYGPAAIEDLLPRLRVIASALDEAHAAGQVHGSLHPKKIFVSADTTQVAGLGSVPGAEFDAATRGPYAAPEVVAGAAPAAAADQYAMAAIAYEWLFGRRISGAAARPVDVRTLPGVDRAAMSQVFTRALAPIAADRFASCTAFCDALDASVIPVLPLGALDDRDDEVLDTGFTPEPAPPVPVEPVPVKDEPLAEPVLAAREARFDSFEPALAPPVEPVTSWQPSAAYTPPRQVPRFSGGMLIVSCLVGMVVGFAAGYMARPRALQSGPIQTMAAPAEAGRAGGAGRAGKAGGAGRAGEAGGATTPGTDAMVASAPPAPPALPAPPARPAPPAPANGRLLVRSTPSGASVEVDGVARGVTPLALRDLELGSRAVTVTRRGYIAEEQRVVLTRARPSRSLELRLTAASASAAGGRSGETLPKPAGSRAGAGAAAAGQRLAATGTLLIESRPAGAAVTINGQSRGLTPLTIDALAPGDYRVNLSLAGYQPFATTVRVVAGERTRAAASLSVQE